ncbi:MAG: MurT ligase domain-containing protein [Microbacteriaceae bacterium]|nr:MurT ligase domain-containing protein [Microbacteriaceae bacterium]
MDNALRSFPEGIVVVSGSVGKSTTTKMVATVIAAHGVNVYTNSTTGNIHQGLVSDFIAQISLSGKLPGDIAVLEMDEGQGSKIVANHDLRVALLNNVVRDQVERFHNPAKVVEYLEKIAKRATGAVVINHDDAALMGLVPGFKAPAHYFGISESVYNELPDGLPLWRDNKDERLAVGQGVRVISSSQELVEYEISGKVYPAKLPLDGLHYAVDGAAAMCAAQQVLGDKFDATTAIKALENFETVFWRDEILNIRGEHVRVLLFQNPASLYFNLKNVPADTEQLLFAFGEGDGNDLAYFWQSDFSSLHQVTFATGEKAGEAALMLGYAGCQVDIVEPDLAKALDDFLALPAPKNGMKTILSTFGMMWPMRHHLKTKHKVGAKK